MKYNKHRGCSLSVTQENQGDSVWYREKTTRIQRKKPQHNGKSTLIYTCKGQTDTVPDVTTASIRE